jgi:TonB family protein
MTKLLPLLSFLIFANTLTYANNLDDWKTFTNESTVLSTQKQYDRALQLTSQALAIAEQEPGDQAVRTVTSLTQLGWIHQSMNHFSLAENAYNRAIKIQSKMVPVDQSGVERNLIFLVKLHASQADIKTALPYIVSILERLEKSNGEHNGLLLVPLESLGRMYMDQAQPEQAAPYLLRALAITEKFQLRIGQDLKTSLIHLADAYKKTHKIEEAKQIEKRLEMFPSSMPEMYRNRSQPYVDLRDCKPEYPREALRHELSGVVLVNYLVDIDGQILEKKTLKSTGWKSLDDAVSNAISACRVWTSIHDGNPVRAWGKIRYVWSLEGKPLNPEYQLIPGSCLASEKFSLAPEDEAKLSIRLALTLNGDGQASKATIIDRSSSNNIDIDLAAIKLAETCKFKPTNPDEKPTSKIAYVRYFWNKAALKELSQ